MALAWIVLEVVGQIGGAIFAEVILEITHALDADRGARWIAAAWFLGCGVLVGALTLVVAPERLLTPGTFRGASLLITPLALGAIMEWCGRVRGRGSKRTSHLATCYGGAALGIGLSAGRLIGLAFAADVRAP